MGQKAEEWIGKQVGELLVTSAELEHFRGYECAAWWHKYVSLPGVYPVFLERNTFVPCNLKVTAEVAAVVHSDNFPALWCGSPVGEPYYTLKNRGQRVKFKISDSLIDAALNTVGGEGAGGAKFRQFRIQQDVWEVVREEAVERIISHHFHYTEEHARWVEGGCESLEGSRRLSSMHYNAEQLAFWSKKYGAFLEYSDRLHEEVRTASKWSIYKDWWDLNKRLAEWMATCKFADLDDYRAKLFQEEEVSV